MFRKMAFISAIVVASALMDNASANPFLPQHGYHYSYYHYSMPSYGYGGAYVVPVYYRVPIYIIPRTPTCGCESALPTAPAAQPAAPAAQPVPAASDPAVTPQAPQAPVPSASINPPEPAPDADLIPVPKPNRL
ncbi:MAG: hypothetical protein RIK87_02195 [Fuerstiella sp.]